MLKLEFISSTLAGFAFLVFGLANSILTELTFWNIGCIFVGVSCLILGYILFPKKGLHQGGAGGAALAAGHNSDAEGGAGGKGIAGKGGRGGDAIAQGMGSTAKGGRGGDA